MKYISTHTNKDTNIEKQTEQNTAKHKQKTDTNTRIETKFKNKNNNRNGKNRKQKQRKQKTYFFLNLPPLLEMHIVLNVNM